MLDMIVSGKLVSASSTAISLSKKALEYFENNIETLRSKILLRPQEISNHPEVIRRLGVLSMNGMIEADMYGNVNSTHIMGTRIMNGIGGSGDFTRNAYISAFMTPSTAKGGAISCIVPMVSHVDHTEHGDACDCDRAGSGDLRGLSPKQRATTIIDKVRSPHLPRYAARLLPTRTCAMPQASTHHILPEALSWHTRFEETNGDMRTKA